MKRARVDDGAGWLLDEIQDGLRIEEHEWRKSGKRPETPEEWLSLLRMALDRVANTRSDQNRRAALLELAVVAVAAIKFGQAPHQDDRGRR